MSAQTKSNNLKEIKKNTNRGGITGFIAFIAELVKKMNRDQAIPYAYQLTYSLIFAVFPFLIFLFTLLAFLNFDSGQVLSAMAKVMPGESFVMVRDIILNLLHNQQGGLLSISILTAIWSASAGFRAFIKALNNIYGVKEKRGAIKLYLSSLMFVLLLAVGILLSLVLIVFGNQIFDFIYNNLHIDLSLLKSAIKYLFPLAIVFLMFTMMYMFVPSKNVRFRFAFPGAVFSTVAFMVVTFLFQVYVDNFANYSKFYGTLGTLIMLMLWILLLSEIMIIGAEINSVLIIKKAVPQPFSSGERAKQFKELKNQYKELSETEITDESKETLEKMNIDPDDDKITVKDVRLTGSEEDEKANGKDGDMKKETPVFDKNNDELEKKK